MILATFNKTLLTPEIFESCLLRGINRNINLQLEIPKYFAFLSKHFHTHASNHVNDLIIFILEYLMNKL